MITLLEIKKRLEFHEGFSSEPYKCSSGKITIGIGRNLDDNPYSEVEKISIKDLNNITKAEAYYLLANDIDRVIKELKENIHFYWCLSDERQYALIDMCFQMGISGLLKFKNMLSYMEKGDFDKASKECLNSRYAKQTPSRARRIAFLIKTNQWKICY